MKNKNLEDKYGITTVTENNKHLFSKEIQSAFGFFNSKEKPFFSSKYFSAQKTMIQGNVTLLHQTSPDLPIKHVLLQIMETLPDFLPADNLVEVTKIITSQWQKLQQKVAA